MATLHARHFTNKGFVKGLEQRKNTQFVYKTAISIRQDSNIWADVRGVAQSVAPGKLFFLCD